MSSRLWMMLKIQKSGRRCLLHFVYKDMCTKICSHGCNGAEGIAYWDMFDDADDIDIFLC